MTKQNLIKSINKNKAEILDCLWDHKDLLLDQGLTEREISKLNKQEVYNQFFDVEMDSWDNAMFETGYITACLEILRLLKYE